jgi:ABC-type transport system involved in Fe-S cluster assembly fused permease/ATPase subunit
LDTTHERAIQKALDTLSHNRTTLVIAHRLSTIQEADQIIVFRDGQITEVGKHMELLEIEGEYARFHADGIFRGPLPN